MSEPPEFRIFCLLDVPLHPVLQRSLFRLRFFSLTELTRGLLKGLWAPQQNFAKIYFLLAPRCHLPYYFFCFVPSLQFDFLKTFPVVTDSVVQLYLLEYSSYSLLQLLIYDFFRRKSLLHRRTGILSQLCDRICLLTHKPSLKHLFARLEKWIRVLFFQLQVLFPTLVYNFFYFWIRYYQ